MYRFYYNHHYWQFRKLKDYIFQKKGEINFDFLFAHLDRIGYKGWVGCEYTPAAATEAGLAWLKP